MATSFLNMYTSPPRGTIQAGHPTTSSTLSLKHVIPPEMTPDRVVDAPDLPDQLVQWARDYLSNIQHRPSPPLHNVFNLVSSNFDRAMTGNEGTIVSLYAETIKTWSTEFVEAAEQLGFGAVKFKGCRQVAGVRAGWQWTRDSETRMIVELNGREVFQHHCNDIRALATANSGAGSPLVFDRSGHATGATSILLKLGVQMIVDDCQFGVVFGGDQFILFAIVARIINRNIVHQMLCSPILETAPDPSSNLPGAIEVTIATLLASKSDFFEANMSDTAGITVRQRGGVIRPLRSASKTTKSYGPLQAKGEETAQNVTGGAVNVTRLEMSYYVRPDINFTFQKLDTSQEEPGQSFETGGRVGKLILYDFIGGGATGSVFDADLETDSEVVELAAKFYDPDTAAIEDAAIEGADRVEADTSGSMNKEDLQAPEEVHNTESRVELPNEDKEYMFKNEINTYQRLSNSSICPHFYGAYQGIGVTGYPTGMVLMEKLPMSFENYDDMTETEKEAVYNHLLELHRLGIHHGDVEARNFGRRAETKTCTKRKRGESENPAQGSVVICDFSHSRVFEECDVEQCMELSLAKEEIQSQE